MKKIRVLLYKTQWWDGHFADGIISLVTRSKYSHIEIWTPDNNGVFECGKDFKGNPVFLGDSWTSTMRGENNGCRKAPASEILRKPENWDYVELEVGDLAYRDAIKWMEFQVRYNQGYSKWDLLKFISFIHFNDNERFICSEFCDHALEVFGVGDFGKLPSPADIYKQLNKMGHEPKSLIQYGKEIQIK